MDRETRHLVGLAGRRLSLQSSYEPKLRALVETRASQLGFDSSERRIALRSMDALVWKLTAAAIHLERLWENRESYAMRRLLSTTLQGATEPRRFTDKEVAFLSAEFEAYLVQAVAFVSVSQVHTLDACRVSFGGLLTSKKYQNAVRTAPPNVRDRLTCAERYYADEVSGQGKWGRLLKSLRDRVVHFDRVRPSTAPVEGEDEELVVRGLSLDRLAQDFENGSNDLLVEVIAPIWERQWQPGAYRPGMWE